MLCGLDDGAYDLLCIDGDHSYGGACGDAQVAKSKVRVGELMVFNDYCRLEWAQFGKNGRWRHYGIMYAANELLVQEQPAWEVAYYAFSGFDSCGDIGLRRLK